VKWIFPLYLYRGVYPAEGRILKILYQEKCLTCREAILVSSLLVCNNAYGVRVNQTAPQFRNFSSDKILGFFNNTRSFLSGHAPFNALELFVKRGVFWLLSLKVLIRRRFELVYKAETPGLMY
jgi:hypothetical protein